MRIIPCEHCCGRGKVFVRVFPPVIFFIDVIYVVDPPDRNIELQECKECLGLGGKLV